MLSSLGLDRTGLEMKPTISQLWCRPLGNQLLSKGTSTLESQADLPVSKCILAQRNIVENFSLTDDDDGQHVKSAVAKPKN
jgi:hypothetical protein